MRPLLLAILVLTPACSTHGGASETHRAPPPPPEAPRPTLLWAALGDSYTKGEAARSGESWPAVACARLRAEGKDVELAVNLGRTGWTASNVLERQVPWLGEHHADLVSIQVGINDLVQGVSEEDFRAAFRRLLEAVIQRVGSPRRVLAVTIPDFSVARAAPRFGNPAELHDAIIKRNAIILDESARAGVRTADIFARSRDAAQDPSLLAGDGIHPSAAGYAAWVPVVQPVLENALDQQEK
jgi:lysophospholipase L1-like esterase